MPLSLIFFGSRAKVRDNVMNCACVTFRSKLEKSRRNFFKFEFYKFKMASTRRASRGVSTRGIPCIRLARGKFELTNQD